MARKRFFVVLDLVDSKGSDLLANDKQSVVDWLATVMRPDEGTVDPTVYSKFEHMALDKKQRKGPFKR